MLDIAIDKRGKLNYKIIIDRRLEGVYNFLHHYYLYIDNNLFISLYLSIYLYIGIDVLYIEAN